MDPDKKPFAPTAKDKNKNRDKDKGAQERKNKDIHNLLLAHLRSLDLNYHGPDQETTGTLKSTVFPSVVVLDPQVESGADETFLTLPSEQSGSSSLYHDAASYIVEESYPDWVQHHRNRTGSSQTPSGSSNESQRLNALAARRRLSTGHAEPTDIFGFYKQPNIVSYPPQFGPGGPYEPYDSHLPHAQYGMPPSFPRHGAPCPINNGLNALDALDHDAMQQQVAFFAAQGRHPYNGNSMATAPSALAPYYTQAMAAESRPFYRQTQKPVLPYTNPSGALVRRDPWSRPTCPQPFKAACAPRRKTATFRPMEAVRNAELQKQVQTSPERLGVDLLGAGFMQTLEDSTAGPEEAGLSTSRYRSAGEGLAGAPGRSAADGNAGADTVDHVGDDDDRLAASYLAADPHSLTAALTRIEHGFSPNYQGNIAIERNRSAPIPSYENCSVWVRNLPTSATTRDLLRPIRGIGRVWASHINAPEPDKGHLTCAAKIVFFDRAAAARFHAAAASRVLGTDGGPAGHGPAGYVVRGRRADVAWNRIRSAADPREGATRVLVVVGPPAFVNARALTAYFADKLQFQVDEVIEHGRGGGRGGRVLEEDGSGDGPDGTAAWGPEQALVEFRFGSWRCQADSARMALQRERPDCRVWFAPDPCDMPRGYRLAPRVVQALLRRQPAALEDFIRRLDRARDPAGPGSGGAQGTALRHLGGSS